MKITHRLLTQRHSLKSKNMIRHHQCLAQLNKKQQKGRANEIKASSILDLSGIESVMKDKNMNTSKLIRLIEAQERRMQEQE